MIERVKDEATRRFSLEACAEHGWSRAALTVPIESRLHERQGRAPSNFAATLPPPQSDLAQQVTKDPYVFDFLTLAPDARERDLERRPLRHLRDLFVELGVSFAFVGSQVHLHVAGEDLRVDLRFYHLRLRGFVVVELKTGTFQPEHAGKMNFYLPAEDAQLRHPSDQPTIGILLCKDPKDLVVAYALRDLAKPVGGRTGRRASWSRGPRSYPRPWSNRIERRAALPAERRLASRAQLVRPRARSVGESNEESK